MRPSGYGYLAVVWLVIAAFFYAIGDDSYSARLVLAGIVFALLDVGAAIRERKYG